MILQLAGDHANVREQVVFAAWKATIGRDLENKCRPVRLENKRLVVAVLNESYESQLQKLSGEYLFRLNSMLGQPVVTFIEYRIDPAQIGLKPFPGPHPESRRSREIRSEFLPNASRIDDPALRESFLRAASRYLERNEIKNRNADN